jgi:hypothetical protein
MKEGGTDPRVNAASFRLFDKLGCQFHWTVKYSFLDQHTLGRHYPLLSACYPNVTATFPPKGTDWILLQQQSLALKSPKRPDQDTDRLVHLVRTKQLLPPTQPFFSAALEQPSLPGPTHTTAPGVSRWPESFPNRSSLLTPT